MASTLSQSHRMPGPLTRAVNVPHWLSVGPDPQS